MSKIGHQMAPTDHTKLHTKKHDEFVIMAELKKTAQEWI